MEQNPYQSPPEPAPVEGGAGLFIALLLTALAMGTVLVSWLSGFISIGIALLQLLVLTPILLWILSEMQKRALRASGLPATSLTVAQTLLVAFVGLLAAAATFLAICGGTAVGAMTLFDGGHDGLGLLFIGLFAGVALGITVGIWAGWKTHRSILKANDGRVEVRERLDVRRAGEGEIKIEPPPDDRGGGAT